MANKITVTQFDDIARGTSLTIPVLIKRLDETPFDLTGYSAHFTLKAEKFDNDYDDNRALITKDIEIGERGCKGRFNIVLSSKETWLDPGEYHFDIELVHNHGVARLATFNTKIVGGPTNRTVDHEEGHIFFSDCINVVMQPNQPIVFMTNLISDPPDTLIETMEADPPYLMEELDEHGHDVRLGIYGPRVSIPMVFKMKHDAEEHHVRFDKFFIHELPEACPLKDAMISIKNRDFRIVNLTKKMQMEVTDTFVMHSPETTYDGHGKHTDTDDFWWVGDNVDVGRLHIMLHDGNDYIDITGTYYMEDDHGQFSYWMLTVNWYNWFDN